MAVITSGEQVLAFNDIPRELVFVPEWKDASVWVRGMSAAEKDDYEQGMMQISKKGGKLDIRPLLNNARAKLVAKCAITAEGVRLFTDAQADKLGEKSATAISRLADVIRRLSGMAEDEGDAGKSSESNRDGGSTSV